MEIALDFKMNIFKLSIKNVENKNIHLQLFCCSFQDAWKNYDSLTETFKTFPLKHYIYNVIKN